MAGRSISVAATNAMRSRLGMDPIEDQSEDAHERAAVDAAKELNAAKQEQEDIKQAAMRVLAHKETRLYNEAIKGKTISELHEDIGSSSATDWISSLKAKGPPKAPELPKKRTFSQTTGAGADLRIRHDADEFNEGETVILTLKDRRIGDEDGDADDDELENLDIVKDKIVQRNLDRKAKRLRSENEETGEIHVLEKYDEIKDELDAKKGGMVLTSSGSVIDKAASIRAKLAGSLATNKIRYDFGSSSSRPASNDFYSKEELATSKKSTLARKIRKKVKAPRTDHASIDSGSISADHGSRETSKTTVKARIAAANLEMKLKREKFERAIAKSDSKSHTLLDSATYVPEDADEGLVLQETLARANRSAQRNRQLEKQVHDQTVQSKLPTAKISAAVITESDNDGIIFSAASDFMINVRANAQEARQPTAVKAEVIVPTVEPAEEVTESSDEDAMDIDGIDRGPQASVKQEESSEPSDEEDLTFMKDVSSVDGGISGALRLIRSRGLANPKALHPLVGGRSRDGRSEEYKDPLPHVRLDRVDEFGRSMTQKAAFRELSYRFHGHRPGAKKREKVLKELGQQLKRQEAISGKAVSSTQRLKDATSKTGRHYVVMDSKSGAYGGVTTQKLSIDVAEPESVDVGEEESRAYVHGSKKVEFALNKAE